MGKFPLLWLCVILTLKIVPNDGKPKAQEDGSESGEEEPVNLAGFGEKCNDHIKCDEAKYFSCSAIAICECNLNSDLSFSPTADKCVESSARSSENTDEERRMDSDDSLIGSEELEKVKTPDEPDFGRKVETGKNETEIIVPNVVSSTTTPSPVNPRKEDSLEFDDWNVNSEDEVDVEKKEDTVQGEKNNPDEHRIMAAGSPSLFCTSDRDCQDGKWGRFSRCTKSTGICECYDTDEDGHRNTVLISGTCYILKTINDPCETHAECFSTITGKAWCQTDLSTYTRSCQCELYHFWDPALQECLGIARNGTSSKCKTDDQCAHIDGLGPLSRCGEASDKCECYHSNKPTVYYDDTLKCYIERQLEDECITEKECAASLGEDSYCAVDPEGSSEETVCLCSEGKICIKTTEGSSGRPSMSTFTMIIFIVAGVVILIGIVVCFVLRRNTNYNVVAQTES